MKTLRQCKSFGEDFLKENNIVDAKTDAWLLMEYVFHISRSTYFMQAEEMASDTDIQEYERLLKVRATHYPLQYITHEAWFYGRKFYVDEQVLIPRQDTETLIEEVLKKLHSGMHILDMCTGSGCILLTLLKECDIAGCGADVSREALLVAQKNATLLSVDKSTFLQSNLFDEVTEHYDIIVSNPPYIETAVIETLMEEVRKYEPHIALDGYKDGLYFYRKIAHDAKEYMKQNGWLFFEIGYDQGNALTEIFEKEGYEEIEIVKDLSGNDRVAFAQIRRNLSV